MNRPGPDLPRLLQPTGAYPIDLWLDPLSPATAVIMPHLDLDGGSHGGRPWRFRGEVPVGLRLLPDPGDSLAQLAACCLLAARAWAVQREGDDLIVPMDYDLPWGLLATIQEDLPGARADGLPHLVALAGRQGDWLGDWVAEYCQHPAVRAALEAERADAAAAGVAEVPTVVVADTRFGPAEMPDDVAQQVASLVAG